MWNRASDFDRRRGTVMKDAAMPEHDPELVTEGIIMKLFGRRAGRVEARPALSASASFARGEWPPSYEAAVREGYGRNAVAQRSVRLVADAVGAAPLTASTPDLLALVQARTGGQGLLETVAAQLMLHGNAFVQVLRGPQDEAAALYALRPERGDGGGGCGRVAGGVPVPGRFAGDAAGRRRAAA